MAAIISNTFGKWTRAWPVPFLWNVINDVHYAALFAILSRIRSAGFVPSRANSCAEFGARARGPIILCNFGRIMRVHDPPRCPTHAECWEFANWQVVRNAVFLPFWVLMALKRAIFFRSIEFRRLVTLGIQRTPKLVGAASRGEQITNSKKKQRKWQCG